MTASPPQGPARFVAALERLDRGQLAGLRRSLGGDERGVYWLQGLYARTGYGDARPHQHAALRLVAGLYALRPGKEPAPDDGAAPDESSPNADAAPPSTTPTSTTTIGRLMGQLYRAQDERPSTEKRFLALLDADREGLEHHLRQSVALLAAHDLTPDWTRLTADLLYWGDPVRRTWARDFYREASREPGDQDQSAGDLSASTDDQGGAP